MNYDQSGVINGVKWSTEYLGDRDFQLTVGDLTEKYTTAYPMMFGMDVADISAINIRLDEMQTLAESG